MAGGEKLRQLPHYSSPRFCQVRHASSPPLFKVSFKVPIIRPIEFAKVNPGLLISNLLQYLQQLSEPLHTRTRTRRPRHLFHLRLPAGQLNRTYPAQSDFLTMSGTTFGQKGVEAVKNRDYVGAVGFLDKALESSDSPKWLLARAHANQQLKNYEAALQDAELAYHTAAERGSGDSRKLMIEAQYRRATILFRLGRYADSDCCAKWSMLLAEGRPARENDGVEKNVDEEGRYTVTYEDGVADKKNQPKSGGTLLSPEPTNKTGFEADWNRGYAWRSQALGQLKNLPADHPGRKVTVTKIPTKPEKRKVERQPAKLAEQVIKEETTKISTPAPIAPGSVPDEKMKLRIDFYQTNQNITISLFAKDLKKDDLQVQISSNQVN